MSACLSLLLGGCARPHLFNKERGIPEAPLTDAQVAEEAERDAAFPEQTGSRNVTAEFTPLFYQPGAALTAEREECLTRHEVLLVHGLMGEVGVGVRRFLDRFGRKQRVLDYQKDQERVLEEHGIRHRLVTFRSKNVDRSGRKIAESILKSERPVLLFSHSKGCVDTLDALIKLQKQDKLERVAGWIAVQGVFQGAPKAQRFVEHGGLRNLGIVGMRMLGGNFNAIRDLTPEARAAYHLRHRDQIEQIAAQVPILCFASWETLKEAEWDIDAEKKESPRFASAFKIQPQSSILAGCDYVAKAGISHSATVVSSSRTYNRVAFTKALFAMLADRILERRE